MDSRDGQVGSIFDLKFSNHDLDLTWFDLKFSNNDLDLTWVKKSLTCPSLMDSKFFFIYFILFYFILDHFVFTDEDDDTREGEWEEGKLLMFVPYLVKIRSFTTVYEKNTVVYDLCISPYFSVYDHMYYSEIWSYTTPYTESVTVDLSNGHYRPNRY